MGGVAARTIEPDRQREREVLRASVSKLQEAAQDLAEALTAVRLRLDYLERLLSDDQTRR